MCVCVCPWGTNISHTKEGGTHRVGTNNSNTLKRGEQTFLHTRGGQTSLHKRGTSIFLHKGGGVNFYKGGAQWALM